MNGLNIKDKPHDLVETNYLNVDKNPSSDNYHYNITFVK